ncbi:MAG: serine/threonine-protein kinase [Vicinamibacterales bacterium]
MAERDPEPLTGPGGARGPDRAALPEAPTAWLRLQALFDRVAALPLPEQGAALDDAAREAPELADAVRRLLARDRRGADWIGRVVTAVADAASPDRGPAPRVRIGPYRLVREIGRGGMGTVFEAEREDVFTKRVAIKIATGAVYSADLARRFHEERQILARLEHPSIARLLDGGTTEDHLPYLVMEYVDGVPLTTHLDQHPHASLSERLALFLQVCEAVQYAHESLVIHRDLKPANILVASGQVRLLDFGIATLTSPVDGRGRQTGSTLATLDYCSPEQLSGLGVTTRTDVYALGLVLYELLTGERGQHADTTSPIALQQSIVETPVPAPSDCLARRGDAGLARRLRGDLDTIVGAATEKDAARRYASAAALAEDVRRHLAHEPIRARAAGRAYRATRFVRRRWRPLAVTAVVVALVVTGVAAVLRQARQTERRFQQVRQLANTLMTDVHTAIRDLPASTAAQAIVVQTAADYLDGLASDAGGDRALRIEIAEGYVRVAALAYSLTRPSLERPDDAASYYDRAEATVAGLERDAPGDPAVLVARSRLETARAQFLDARGRKAEALTAIIGAADAAERVLAIRAADETGLEALSDALSVLMATFEDSVEASARLGRYLEVAELRVGRGPVTAASLSDLGVAYAQAGKLASSSGTPATATRHYRRGIEFHERALALEPENAAIRRDLMLAWNHVSEQSLGERGTTSYAGSGARFTPLPPDAQALAQEAALKTVEHATWLFERDPSNATVAMDFAIAVGRSAPAFPIGDPEPIRMLDRSLATLATLAREHASGVSYFLIEFLGSRAERHRQRGEIARARRDWELVRRELAAFRESGSTAYRHQRMVIPMFQNWALTLAEQGDRRAAAALAADVVQLSDEVGASEASYARAAGWPPRVRGWLAGFHHALGDEAAAARARRDSLRMWAEVASRSDVPEDVVAEARAAIAAQATR